MLGALLNSTRLAFKHVPCQSQIEQPGAAQQNLSGITPVALLVLLPIVRNNWELLDGPAASRRTAMLRLLLRHETECTGFVGSEKEKGPVVKHSSFPNPQGVGVVALAAYMCHALPMHNMLLVRFGHCCKPARTCAMRSYVSQIHLRHVCHDSLCCNLRSAVGALSQSVWQPCRN